MKFYQSIIKIPTAVTIEQKNNILRFSGPLGYTTINLKKVDPEGLGGFLIDKQSQQIKFVTHSKSFFGLMKSLLNNKLQGVTRGFLVYLKINGIGYRASLEKNLLSLKLGYSHDILYKIPNSIQLFLLDPTVICLFGVDKNQITQIAAKIRNLRGPSVYKGKGISKFNEKIIYKVGKRK